MNIYLNEKQKKALQDALDHPTFYTDQEELI